MKISEYLKNKNIQCDYVNIPVGNNIDEKRFIDIYTIINIVLDEFRDYKTRIINKVTTFFEELLNAIKEDDVTKYENLSKKLT